MTFLNPFVLFGLAAAAIPIILHLLNIRKLRTIEFSTLTFLKELQRSKMRKVKIRQWLLLLLRTALIILIVFAFSRPALRGDIAGIGTHARSTVVIILDDTYSMSLHNEKGTFLKQAQAAALKLLNLLKEGDDAFVLRVSDLPHATTDNPSHDIRKLKELVEQTHVSYRRQTVYAALRLASRLIGQSRNFNKEIYILTDNQKTTMLGAQRGTSQGAERIFSEGVKVFVLPLAEKAFDNVGIANGEIPPALFQKNKPFTIRTTIKNYGPVRNFVSSLFLNGSRVMQKTVSIGPGQTATVEFAATVKEAGWNSGFVELEEDQLSADDRWYYTMHIPDQLHVLLITSDQHREPFLPLALTIGNDERSSAQVTLKEIRLSQLTSTLLDHSDAVVVSNVAEFSPQQAEQISRYVKGGGGLMFFPGTAMNPAPSIFLSRLGLPEILMPTPAPKGTFTTFDKIDFDHPVFQGMFDQKQPGGGEKREIESPHISSSLGFASERGLRTIISLSNGAPFLWEKALGTGRLLGFSVPATTEWSDFPLKGIFVPLLHQSLLYLTSGDNTIVTGPVFVGERVDIPFGRLKKRLTSSDRPIRVAGPSAYEMKIQPYIIGSTEEAVAARGSFEDSPEPGVYTLIQGKDTLGQLPVNMDTAESDGERTTDKEIFSMLNHLGIEKITLVRDAATVEQVVLQSRYGVELWKYFLAFALIVAILEMAVAREAKREIEVND